MVCDPHDLSKAEQERLCRGFVRQLYAQLGPNLDVPAPDVMTNSQHMLWMLDEYETITGGRYPGMITGKPVGMGGSLGRTEATGYGVVYVLKEFLREKNIPIESTTEYSGLWQCREYAARKFAEARRQSYRDILLEPEDGKAYTFKRKRAATLNSLSA